MKSLCFCFVALCIFSGSMLCLGVPSANSERQRKMLQETFSKTRNHQVNNNGKQEARLYIKNFFKDMEFTVVTQSFATERNDVTGENIIGILKGSKYGKSTDKFYGIAAHYDTMPDTPGVDDNGSGVVAMLEAARILKESGGNENTIIFIAFDFEEWYTDQGTACTDIGCGSTYFVQNWPQEMQKTLPISQFGGIIVMDSVMNFENIARSQNLPQGFDQVFPAAYADIKKDDFEGDFLVMVARSFDSNIASAFAGSWKEDNGMEIERIILPVSNPTTSTDERTYGDFFRSDHREFWFKGLPAIFISDTANLRGYMKKCYHHECDTLDNTDEDNIKFLGRVTDTLVQTMLKLSPPVTSGTSPRTVISPVIFVIACVIAIFG